jgi:hypothetical protein
MVRCNQRRLNNKEEQGIKPNKKDPRLDNAGMIRIISDSHPSVPNAQQIKSKRITQGLESLSKNE